MTDQEINIAVAEALKASIAHWKRACCRRKDARNEHA